MTGSPPIVDFAEFKEDALVTDLAGLRRYNPQRFEMEQLTAIVFEDPERRVCVGYKDVTHDEFWARGDLPDPPLMPSVLMCEAAGQMCGYYVQKYSVIDTNMLGFAGMQDVCVLQSVRPGTRLWVMGKLLRGRVGVMVRWQFQTFVERSLVCEGVLKGMPLPPDWLAKQQQAAESVE